MRPIRTTFDFSWSTLCHAVQEVETTAWWHGACRLCKDHRSRSGRRLRSTTKRPEGRRLYEGLRRQVSSVAERAQLNGAIDYFREGDVLIATKLDRLARSMRHLLQIVDEVKAKGASLRILGMSLDTDTATGTMMLQVLGAVAEHERSLMLERQREGIAKAKAEGKYKGRARTAMAKAGEVEALLAKGVNPTEVARKLGIGRSSVYRAMKERKIKRQPAVYRPA